LTHRSLFPIGLITQEEFLRDYWRKRPLHVKGFGDQLGIGLDEGAFSELVGQMERSHPGQVRRSKSGVIFAQNLDLCCDHLSSIAKRIRLQTSWPSVWFDGILTQERIGVGFHCDPNDNFSIQRKGIKHWKLLNPAHVDREAIRRTILGQDSELEGDAAEGALEFLVEPGDILYIPLLWPHHGVPQGESLSFTLVADAESGLSLLPLLYLILSNHENWWSPLPTPRVVDPETANILPIDSEFSAKLGDLLSHLASESVQTALEQEWWRTRYEHLVGQ
jgi:50S ribosomal protein L16 3-hydroxylase